MLHRDILLDLLTSQESQGLSLVFVETKRGADALEEYLLRNNFPATSIHGDRYALRSGLFCRVAHVFCFYAFSSSLAVIVLSYG